MDSRDILRNGLAWLFIIFWWDLPAFSISPPRVMGGNVSCYMEEEDEEREAKKDGDKEGKSVGYLLDKRWASPTKIESFSTQATFLVVVGGTDP